MRVHYRLVFKLLQCFGAPFIVVHMGGSKETFFGSDRFELMASVIGELYSWNTGQGVTECFVPFLPSGEKWEGPLTDVQAQL